jgi:outer membrane protein assembly factor BamA
VTAALLLPLSVALAEPQQAGINARGIVESAEISGIDEDEISQDIHDAVRKLVGQAFDQQAADDLVKRIQAEKPEFTATTRLSAGDESDRLRVIFLLEKTNGEVGDEANVNSRYTVERVEIQGFDESKFSMPIRDELKALIGVKLDQQKADQIKDRMEDELRPRHYVTKRVVKGSDRQHIVVVYEVKSVRWIPFVDQPPQRIVYHSKQNFSAVVNGNIVDNDTTRLYFGLASDQDSLIERYAGFNLGVEATKIGTDRLGLAMRYARYHDRWQPATVLADRNAIYRERSTFDPTITFAFDPRVRLTAGVSLSDLQMQYPEIHDNHANAAVASLHFLNAWRATNDNKHGIQADYEFRSGNHNLDSDFIYTRHFVQSQYIYGNRENQLLVRFLAGRISGTAPLFEQFSLGDTLTLRGWNKFDVAPAGGDRVIHGTLQFGWGGPTFGKGRIRIDNRPQANIDVSLGFHVFYDVGAVGDRGVPMKTRHSAGFGIGGPAGFFAEIGFPIRATNPGAVFMMGFRF